MASFTLFVNTTTGFGALLVGLLGIVLILSRFIRAPFISDIRALVENNRLTIATVISVLAVLASLTYSNIIGYTPCDLCWFQRIFIYPQAIIFIVTWVKKQSERDAFMYSFVLSCIAMCFSLYHLYIYYGGYSPLPCSATASCTARYVFEWGFMTIPLMAFLTLFTLIVISRTKPRNRLS